MVNRSDNWGTFSLVNETTLNSTSKDGMAAEWVSKVKLGFNVVFLLVGTVSNLFVVAFNAKIKNRRGQAPAYEYFISNLCLSEIAFVSMMFFDIYYNLSLSLYYCKAVSPFLTMILIVSMYTVAAIALFRCRVIVNPFKPKPSSKCIYMTIAGLWFFALIDVIPLVIVLHIKNGRCEEVWSTQTLNKLYTIALFLLQYPVPLTILAVSYIKIIVFLKRHEIPRTNLSKDTASRMAARRKRDTEILKMSVIIVILYAILTLPLQIAWIANIFNYSALYRTVSQFSNQLLLLHSCCNPLVYGTIYREFRSQAMNIMRNVFTGVFQKNTIENVVVFKGNRVNIALQTEK